MVLVSSVIAKKDIQKWLKSRNLKYPWARVLPYCLSPTICKLKKIAEIRPDKFYIYAKVIETFMDMAKIAGVTTKLVIHLPSLEALLNIDIEFLFEKNEAARKEIISKCYLPAEGKIDLNPLVTINRRYSREI